jgi:hypothetical protein
MLVSGILGDGLTFLLRSRRNNPTSGPVSPRFMVRIYESSTSEPQNCTTTSQAVNLRQSCPSFHFIMPPSSSQSDTIAGLHLPDITARSLSYFMLGALTDALTDKPGRDADLTALIAEAARRNQSAHTWLRLLAEHIRRLT